MLDITFYSETKKSENVVVPESFLEWLAKSQFTKIDKSVPKELIIDDEPIELELVRLVGKNRRKYSDFFRDEIVEESSIVLEKLGSSPSKKEYQDATFKLLLLQKLRKLVEDESYQYIRYL
ncbi:MAG: hypothetical protein KDK90_28105 [Leptospiraceae bacterium]|nr:hypothetical protein [Leptospiraceae bacterium]